MKTNILNHNIFIKGKIMKVIGLLITLCILAGIMPAASITAQAEENNVEAAPPPVTPITNNSAEADLLPFDETRIFSFTALSEGYYFIDTSLVSGANALVRFSMLDTNFNPTFTHDFRMAENYRYKIYMYTNQTIFIGAEFLEPVEQTTRTRVSVTKIWRDGANALVLNGHVYMNIGTKDTLWYYLDIPLDGTYSFTLSDNNSDENYGPNDIHIEVYNQNQVRLGNDSNNDRNSSASASGYFTKGERCYVSAYFSDPLGDGVSLKLNALSSPATTACSFNSLQSKSLQTRKGNAYSFTAPAAGEYCFMVNPDSESPDFDRNSLELTLYSPGSLGVLGAARNKDEYGLIELERNLSAGETIYFEVYNWGRYTAYPSVYVDNVNNSFDNSREFKLTRSATVEIKAASTERYYHFTPEITDWYTFEGVDYGNNQPNLELLDDSWQLMAYGSNDVTDLLYAGETYYLVASYSGQQTGSFDLSAASTYDTFEPGIAYAPRHIFKYGTKPDGSPVLYTVLQSHSSTGYWNPGSAVSLYKKIDIPRWVQPLGSTDYYFAGDKVLYNGLVWISDIDGNVWAPGVAGWSVYNGDL